MPNSTQQRLGDDMRLLSFAYVQALVQEDEEARRFLERDSRWMAKCVAGLAFFLMDLVVIPVENGVDWRDGWVEVDFKARSDPKFRANLFRRGRYRRLAMGATVRPKRRLRRTARDCVDMLYLAHLSKHGRDSEVPPPQAVLDMLAYFRERFIHLGGAARKS
ncbi:hypothetical protein [Streptomyces werraensis]|uniref:hypothetical protein n=1 Tax=Streptomyces werraensis TaxID=68284 RepID=UPI00341489B8